MDILGRFRLARLLFLYECIRLLLLVIFLFIAPLQSGFPGEGFPQGNYAGGAFFPYLVYLSANALFPLMVLFVWLRPQEYRNYLTLYMAGKIIGVVSFYAWEVFSSREYPGVENVVKSMVLLGGSVFISLADILSVGGAWMLRNKFRRALASVRPLDSPNQSDQAAGSSSRTESGGV